MNIFCLLFFIWRDIYEGHLSLKDADDEKSIYAAKMKNPEKNEKKIEKQFFKIT